jgi:hypothetical protein
MMNIVTIGRSDLPGVAPLGVPVPDDWQIFDASPPAAVFGARAPASGAFRDNVIIEIVKTDELVPSVVKTLVDALSSSGSIVFVGGTDEDDAAGAVTVHSTVTTAAGVVLLCQTHFVASVPVSAGTTTPRLLSLIVTAERVGDATPSRTLAEWISSHLVFEATGGGR